MQIAWADEREDWNQLMFELAEQDRSIDSDSISCLYEFESNWHRLMYNMWQSLVLEILHSSQYLVFTLCQYVQPLLVAQQTNNMFTSKNNPVCDFFQCIGNSHGLANISGENKQYSIMHDILHTTTKAWYFYYHTMYMNVTMAATKWKSRHLPLPFKQLQVTTFHC